MLSVPQAFVEGTLRREGPAGRRWLDALPQQIAHLFDEWQLHLDGPVFYGGMALVILARRGKEPCALRVPWPSLALHAEVAALRAWNGHGAVKVLEANNVALLLERLEFDRTLEGEPLEQALTAAGGLLRQLAIPSLTDTPRLSTHVQDFTHTWPRQWEVCGRPFSESRLSEMLQLALDLAGHAAADLIHTDLHYGNVLASKREAWLAIDPRVLSGDIEYGVAPLLWTRLEDIETVGGVVWALEQVAGAADLNTELARAWTLVRLHDYWLWGLNHGLTIDPARCRRIASALLG